MDGLYGDDVPPWLPGEGDSLTWLEEVRACASFLRAVPVLADLDEAALWRLAQHAEETCFAPGEVVLAEGHDEPDKRFYVIRSGSCDVLRSDADGEPRRVARLACGSYFGELGLLTDQVRNATVQVRGPQPLRTYAFDALTFHRQIAEHVLVFKLIRERRRTVRAGEPASRLRLNRLGILQGMPDPELQFVLRAAEQRHFAAGEAIIVEGERGDRFHVLLEGEVVVDQHGTEVARLGPGEFFGETALLFDTPRTATVRAEVPVVTWSITRAAFQRVVGFRLLSNPQTQERVMQRAEALMRSRSGGGGGGAAGDTSST